MQFDDQQILLHRPFPLHDVRVQVVVPTLTTLLSYAAWEVLGDLGPVFGALSEHNSGQDLVLLASPSPLCKVAAIDQLEPAGVALDLRLAFE